MSEVQIDDNRADFGVIVSQELVQELAQNIDLLSLLVPVGEYVPILTGIPGVPTPDPNVWQEANGSEITNPNSPLRSTGGTQRFTLDMRDRYIKIPSVFGESGQTGGENSTSMFEHNHGGETGFFFANNEQTDRSDALPSTQSFHGHTIDVAFPDPVNVEPPFMTVKFFLRIQ